MQREACSSVGMNRKIGEKYNNRAGKDSVQDDTGSFLVTLVKPVIKEQDSE